MVRSNISIDVHYISINVAIFPRKKVCRKFLLEVSPGNFPFSCGSICFPGCGLRGGLAPNIFLLKLSFNNKPDTSADGGVGHSSHNMPPTQIQIPIYNIEIVILWK
jgi:hypothetical protein